MSIILDLAGPSRPELTSFTIPLALLDEIREIGPVERPGRADWDDYAATYQGPLFTCPVCGWPALESAPRTADDRGSHQICPSCGFQFGLDDDLNGHSYSEWRTTWIQDDMPWSSVYFEPPTGWDPQEQLRGADRE